MLSTTSSHHFLFNSGYFVFFTGYGVSSDAETSFTAKIMLVSGLPLLIILAPKIFEVSYNSKAYNIDILVTLFALIVTLLAYFNYQVFIF